MKRPSNQPGFVERFAARYFEDRRLLLMTIALVVVAGLSSLAIMPRMEDPVLTARSALIITRLPGADAERVESLVTEKIESALRDVDEIDELASTSRVGVSTITVALKETIYETDAIWAKVRGKVEDAIALLPTEASRPVIEESETRAYALILGVVWEDESPADHRVLRRIAVDLQDRIQNISGTEVVDRFGDPGEEISVELDPIKAASLGLTLNSIATQVSDYDVKSSAGQLRGESMSMLIDLDQQLEAVAAIESIPVASANGKDVRLGEIADISLGMPNPMPRSANLNGQEAVVLGAMVSESTQINTWTSRTIDILNEYERRLPQGVALDPLMVQNEYVAARMDQLRSNLFFGAAGVGAVIFLMMGLRAAIIVTLALPLSSLMVLFGMNINGIPIHQMSVTGLIIAFGLLIDNAIVVVDEVKGRLKRGDDAQSAMIGSVKHLAVPLLGSTLTTAFAFAPIALMPGGGGEFVGAIAIAVIMAISASFVLALTVLPTIAALLVSTDSQDTQKRRSAMISRFVRDGFQSDSLARVYQGFIRSCIERPALGILAGLILPITGFYVASTLREQFFPPCDRNQFHVQVDLPMTASIAEAKSTSKEIDKQIRAMGAQRVDWFYGESAPEFYYNVIGDRKGQPNYAHAIVTLGEGENPKPTIRALQEKLDATFVSPRILVRQLEQGPPFEAPVEIRLFGPNLDELRRLGEEVRRRLVNHPQVVAVRSDLNEVLPQLTVDVDESVAAAAEITPGEVARQLSTTLEGVRCGNVIEGNEELPVVVRVSQQRRGDLASIESLDLVLSRGDANADPKLAPMIALANVGLKPESAAIPRLDRQRMNEISVYIEAGVLPSVVQSFIEDSLETDPLYLPSGYSIGFGGEAGERDESVGNLMSTVGLLFVLMVATLVLSFGSFRMAGIIGFVGMLSTGLAMLALAVGGYPFGFISIIGTMGLLGVAINDSIVVLAGIRANKKASEGDVNATVDEVMHATRHVIATTVTTIAGFAPLIVSGGDFWPPLAVAISGGVSGASLLALVLVPALHQWLIASRVHQPNIFRRLLRAVREPFAKTPSFNKVPRGQAA
ncbi:MAG: efflux RND transporter permease subunit [Planctomycetota bacterium]